MARISVFGVAWVNGHAVPSFGTVYNIGLKPGNGVFFGFYQPITETDAKTHTGIMFDST